MKWCLFSSVRSSGRWPMGLSGGSRTCSLFWWYLCLQYVSMEMWVDCDDNWQCSIVCGRPLAGCPIIHYYRSSLTIGRHWCLFGSRGDITIFLYRLRGRVMRDRTVRERRRTMKKVLPKVSLSSDWISSVKQDSWCDAVSESMQSHIFFCCRLDPFCVYFEFLFVDIDGVRWAARWNEIYSVHLTQERAREVDLAIWKCV